MLGHEKLLEPKFSCKIVELRETLHGEALRRALRLECFFLEAEDGAYKHLGLGKRSPSQDIGREKNFELERETRNYVYREGEVHFQALAQHLLRHHTNRRYSTSNSCH